MKAGSALGIWVLMLNMRHEHDIHFDAICMYRKLGQMTNQTCPCCPPPDEFGEGDLQTNGRIRPSIRPRNIAARVWRTLLDRFLPFEVQMKALGP